MSTVAKTHISLNVRDVEKSAAFYEAFFGVPPHKKRLGYVNFSLDSPPLKLALQQHPASPGLGSLSHLGIQMDTTEEVADTRRRLEDSGMISFDEGDTVCCYARQDKVWVTDPDGNGWEVYVLLDEMDDHDDHEFEPSPIITSGVSHATPLPIVAPESCCGPTCCS